eukprot:4441009-Pleurochrysis_carterae.AAC.1
MLEPHSSSTRKTLFLTLYSERRIPLFLRGDCHLGRPRLPPLQLDLPSRHQARKSARNLHRRDSKLEIRSSQLTLDETQTMRNYVNVSSRASEAGTPYGWTLLCAHKSIVR